jgi:hypothetical protein
MVNEYGNDHDIKLNCCYGLFNLIFFFQNQNSSRSTKTVNRLRMRKGRSVVHKNLEDNYGAVVIANHEALAQVLEQVIFNHPNNNYSYLLQNIIQNFIR